MMRLEVHQLAASGTRDQTTVLHGDGAWRVPAGGGGGGAGVEELITQTTLAAAASSVGFASIPSTYSHLRVRFVARGDDASAQRSMHLTVNGDADRTHFAAYLFNDGSEFFNDGSVDDNSRICGRVPGAGATASYAGFGEVVLLDYTGTAFFKHAQSRFGMLGVSDNRQLLAETVWKNTAAITSLTFAPAAGQFIAGTKFWLYGIH